MKAYTDLEQSKKLAEILPIESADMFYDQYGVIRNGKPKERYSDYHQLPVWSLAALLGVLPIVYINNKKEICGPLHIDITDSETPFVLWYVNPLHKGSIVELKTKEYDNMIDACVEMVEKIHVLNLL